MKKHTVLIIFLCIFIFPLMTVKAEVKKDGWHIVESESADYPYVWALYQKGVEVKRISRQLCVHRGWSTAPENSMASFEKSVEEGYPCFETDVRFTKDNIPVLLHDPTINRTGRNADLSEIVDEINVADLTFEELNNYVFPVHGNKVYEEYATNKITKFEDALKYAKDNNLFMLIEIKTNPVMSDEQVATLVNMVKNYNLDGVVQWISGVSSLEKVIAVDPYANVRVLAADTISVTQANSYYDRVKTDNNLVCVPNSEYSFSLLCDKAINMPTDADLYAPASKFDVTFKVNTYEKDISSKTISRIPVGTKVNSLNNKINTSGTVVVNDSVQNVTLKTGDTVKVTFDSGIEYSYTLSLVGDVLGEGKITKAGAKRTARYVIQKGRILLEQRNAMDINNDNQIKMNDVVYMLKNSSN